ncbi:MAG: TonB-dependent receptor [Bacteroidota bacterium]
MIANIPSHLLHLLFLLISGLSFGQTPLLALHEPVSQQFPSESQEEISLESAIQQLGDRHEVKFVYLKAHLANRSTRASILEEQDLERSLTRLLQPHQLRFKKLRKHRYVIRPLRKSQLTEIQLESLNQGLAIEEVSAVASLSSVDQTVTGTIINATTNEPMQGVTVRVKEANVGALTDEKGQFQIKVPAGKNVLLFSYIGFKNQEVVLTGQTDLNLRMEEDIASLDEVVVIGYGTEQRRYLTGAISKVGAEEVAAVPSSSVDAALQGRAAGVQVTNSSGLAGAPVTIRIRGTSSVQASSEPLYVVDGVPIVSGNFSTNNASGWQLATASESNALASLNPADIESIEILKDAAAAAIYGSRGANGVVLITTKQGKQGKTKFDFGYYSGISQETNRIEMLDGPTYLALAREAWDNSNADNLADNDPRNDLEFDTSNDYEKFWDALLPTGLTREQAERTNTDWLDEVFRTGFLQEGNLSVSGGNEKTTFFVGGTYRDEEGMLRGDRFQRFNTRINLDHRLNQRVSVGARTAITFIDNDRIPVAWAGGIGTAQSVALPFVPIFNEDGTYFNPKSGANVVAELDNTEMNNKSNTVLGNVYAQVAILPNLSLRSDFGVNNIYKKEFYYKSAVIREQAIATSILSENLNWNTNHILQYTTTFGKHKLDVMAGLNALRNDFTANIIDGEGFPNPSLKNPENAATQTASINTSNFSFLSFLGRVNYRLGEKLVLGASVRRDGSSRFGPDNRWGTFPAASFAYILSEEPWLKDSKVLTFLKLRGGFGIVGNAEIGNYQYYGSYTTANYVNLPGLVVDVLDNPGLGWESTTQYDLGLDFGFWDGRIQGGADVYLKQTSNLLLEVDVSNITGANTVVTNIGSLENKGVEFFVTTRNTTGNFKWTTDLNLAFNTNQVGELGPDVNLSPALLGAAGIIAPGEPVGVRHLVRWMGVASDDMTLDVTNPDTGEQEQIQVRGGDELFLNQFDELTNIYDFRDKVFTGNAYPTWTGGLNNSFSWKGFDLNVLMTFALGQDIENSEQRFQNYPFGYGWNAWNTLADPWRQAGDQTTVPRLTWRSPGRSYVSTRYLFNADFVRLKNLALGYTFPKSLSNQLGLDYVRIFVRGTNLLVLSDYPGWDPEYNRDETGNTGQGKSWLPSPQQRVFTAGINLSF